MGSLQSTLDNDFANISPGWKWEIQVNGTYRNVDTPICSLIESAYQEYLSNPTNKGILMIDDEPYLDFRTMTINSSLRMQRVRID